MSKYEVKGVKSFDGMEGKGFSASLYCDGKRVAVVSDSAHGGCFDYNWADRLEPKVEVKGVNLNNEAYSYEGTPEEAKLAEHIVGMTFVSEYDQKAYNKDADMFVGELVDVYEENKYLKKACKGKIMVKLESNEEGEYFTFKGKYCPEAKVQIEKWAESKGEEILEIVNERFAA